jgi:hypothetical protein
MSSRHADCVVKRVAKRFDLVACLVLGLGFAGCELVIPADQYTGEPQAAANAGDGVIPPGSMADAADAGAQPEATNDASIGSNDGDQATDVSSATDGTGRADQDTGVSTPDGAPPRADAARPSEGGVKSDATTGTAPRDASAKDVQGDVVLPDGATLECQLPCDDTFCCLGQVCCPSVCDTRRCVLAPSCPSKTNVACE